MSKIWYLTSTCMQFDRIRHSYVAVYMGLATPIPDATYLYFMYRQPMDRVLQDPMIAMHHHNVHYWITARSKTSLSGSTAGRKHRCLDYVQAVQNGPHCIWRCDRLCTWRKRIHCIFAPDALAPFAIVRGAQTYHESLKDVCPQEEKVYKKTAWCGHAHIHKEYGCVHGRCVVCCRVSPLRFVTRVLFAAFTFLTW